MDLAAIISRNPDSKSLEVLLSLHATFTALSTPLAGNPTPLAKDSMKGKHDTGFLISTDRFVNGLRVVGKIAPGEMADASETFSSVMASMHSAEVGTFRDRAGNQIQSLTHRDIQLPHNVEFESPLPAAATLAHRMFGSDVQLSADLSPTQQHSCAGIEVYVFTKFTYLVPADMLRKARLQLPSASFEELLVAVAQARDASAGSRNCKDASCYELLLRKPKVFAIDVTFPSQRMRKDALRETLEAIGTTLDLSQVCRCVPKVPAGDESHVGGDSSKGDDSLAGDDIMGVVSSQQQSLYELRTVVCFGDYHYQAFVFCPEAGVWVLCNDQTLIPFPDWNSVCTQMLKHGMHPGLLLYEGKS